MQQRHGRSGFRTVAVLLLLVANSANHSQAVKIYVVGSDGPQDMEVDAARSRDATAAGIEPHIESEAKVLGRSVEDLGYRPKAMLPVSSNADTRQPCAQRALK